jgi:hypothetical protein
MCIKVATYLIDMAHDAYTDLPTASPFRKILADFWVYDPDLAGNHEDAPAQFWFDVASGEARTSRKDGTPWVTNPCQYHEHEEGKGKNN